MQLQFFVHLGFLRTRGWNLSGGVQLQPSESGLIGGQGG
jgi:hypothetical protein